MMFPRESWRLPRLGCPCRGDGRVPGRRTGDRCTRPRRGCRCPGRATPRDRRAHRSARRCRRGSGWSDQGRRVPVRRSVPVLNPRCRSSQNPPRADAQLQVASGASNIQRMRIVSLLPSATEILFQLGLGDEVVGVTFECDFPVEARTKRIISTSALPAGLTPAEIDAVVKERMTAGEDLYRLDRDAFADIDPTLVVTQDLCAVCAVDVTKVDDAMTYLGCRADVLTLDPMTLDEVIDSVGLVGDATGTKSAAAAVMAECRERLAAVAAKCDGAARRSTLLLEWTDPAFTDGHWVPDMISAAGGTSVMGRPGQNSQGAEWDRIST